MGIIVSWNGEKKRSVVGKRNKGRTMILIIVIIVNETDGSGKVVFRDDV